MKNQILKIAVETLTLSLEEVKKLAQLEGYTLAHAYYCKKRGFILVTKS